MTNTIFTAAANNNNALNASASRNTAQRIRRLADKWEIELRSGRTVEHSTGSVRVDAVEAELAVPTSDVIAACTAALTAYAMIDEDCKRSVDTTRVRIRRAFTKRSIQVIGVYGFRALAGFAKAVVEQCDEKADELDGLLQAYLASFDVAA